MIVTIPTGRFAGSVIQLTSPEIKSIHHTSISIDIEATHVMIDGIEGNEYFKQHKGDACFAGMSDIDIINQVTTDLAEEMVSVINEQLALVFEEKAS
jgi:hypothetical protein